MKNLAVMVVASLVCLPISSLGAVLERFGGGETEVDVDLPGDAGTVTVNITLPAECHVLNATLNVTNLFGQSGHPVGPAIYLNDTLIWSFNGTAFGAFGNQTVFTTGSDTLSKEFFSAGYKTGAIRLPRDAEVLNASVQVNISKPLGYYQIMSCYASVSNDYFGYSVDGAGDVNGDGYDDIIVGAMRNDTYNDDAGRAYIYFGGQSMDNTPDVVFTGAGASDYLGRRVAGAGDLNKDGYDDVLVAAPYCDLGGYSVGCVYVYFGGSSMDNTADLLLTGTENSEMFGTTLAGGLDVNGDGYDDAVVGSPYKDLSSLYSVGRVYVYLGGSSMDNVSDLMFNGSVQNEAFGAAVSSAGDVNDDGYDDLLIAPTSSKKYVDLYYGGQSMDTTKDARFDSPTNGNFGDSVADAGDVNKDGYDDIIIGTSSGGAYLYFGADSNDIDNVSDINMTDSYSASIVSGGGNINNDGYDDVLVKNYVSSTYYLRIYFGGAEMDRYYDSELWFPAIHSFSSAGDVNGDGFSDFIVGNILDDTGATDAGAAYIISPTIGIWNPNLVIGNTTIWNRTKYYNGIEDAGDFAQHLDAYLRANPSSGSDDYGNYYTDVPVNITAGSEGNFSISNLSVRYRCNATVPDFSSALNQYIQAHRAEKDQNGNITVPLTLRSASAGNFTLTDIQIVYDPAAELVAPVPSLSIDEDTSNDSLVDLHAFFEDEYDADSALNFSVSSATNSSVVDVKVRSNRYLSVDSANGSQNDNWTGVVSITVKCNDTRGSVSYSNTFDVTVRNVNDPPVITSTPATNATGGVEYVYQLSVDDGDNDTLSYDLPDAPANMTVSSSGLVNWTPNRHGTYDVTVSVSDGLSTAFQNFSISVPNRPPRFTSLPSTSGLAWENYTYDVDAVDDDGDGISFALDEAPAGMTIDSASGLIGWTPEATGVFAVSVNLSDWDSSVYQHFNITVPNRAPCFSSTPGEEAWVGSEYTYNATATDADRDNLTFSLVYSVAGMTINSTSGRINWTPAKTGRFAITVSVTDGKEEVRQSFNITVPNRAPWFTSVPVTEAWAWAEYEYNVTAADQDNDTLRFNLNCSIPGMAMDATTGRINWTPRTTGVFNVSVLVNDTKTSVEQSFQVTVPNRPPRFTSDPETEGWIGSEYLYNATADDEDLDDLIFRLESAPPGMSLANKTGRLNWTPAASGVFGVRLSVSDNKTSVVQSFNITVPNRLPVFTSSPVTEVLVGQIYMYNVTATDADGDTLAFSLEVCPEGMSIDGPTGRIAWTPLSTGVFPVSVAAWDTKATARQDFNITVPNRPPRFIGTPVTEASKGTDYSYYAAAVDDDLDNLTYHLESSEDGMVINATTGQITWVPSGVGAFQVRVRVSDGKVSVYQNFTITVPNHPPTVTSSPATGALEGQTYMYSVGVADQDGDGIEFTLLSAPGGMTIDASTGLLAWTSAQAGNHSISIKVSDGKAFIFHNFTLSVTAAGVAPAGAPRIVSFTPEGDRVATRPNVQLSFDRDMNVNSVFSAISFIPYVDLSGIQRFNTSYNFSLGCELEPGTRYTVVVSTAARSAKGVPLASAFSWSFATVAAGERDSDLPVVLFNDPRDGTSFFGPPRPITIVFSEAMHRAGPGSLVTVAPSLAGEWGWLNDTGFVLEFRPSGAMPAGRYAVTVSRAMTDESGNPLDGNRNGVANEAGDDHVFEFSVSSAPLTRPQLLLKYPTEDEVESSSSIRLFFDRKMDENSIRDALRIRPPIEGELTSDASGRNFTFTPTDRFLPDTQYFITLEPNATDINGQPLGEAESWSFITAAEEAHPAALLDTLFGYLLCLPWWFYIVMIGTLVAAGAGAAARSRRKRAAAGGKKPAPAGTAAAPVARAPVLPPVEEDEEEPELPPPAPRPGPAAPARAPAPVKEPPPAPSGPVLPGPVPLVKAVPADFAIDDIFLMYQDGRLIKHTTRRLKADMDVDIMTSMLKAVQEFVRESLGMADGGELGSMEYGTNKIVLQKGKHVILAVVICGEEPEGFRDEARSVIRDIESEFSAVLPEWDGVAARLAGTGRFLSRLGSYMPLEAAAQPRKDAISLKSEIEFYQGFVRLKVAVKNHSDTVMTKAALKLMFNEHALRLDRVEPALEMKGDEIILNVVDPGEKKTVAFYLDPQICTESYVEGVLTFKDAHGNLRTVQMPRKLTSVVCPMLYTDENINIAMLRRLIAEELVRNDSKLFSIPPGMRPRQAFDLGLMAVQRHDLRLVREFTDKDTQAAEAWYYGKAKGREDKLVVRVRVLGKQQVLEFHVASSSTLILTGMLAELKTDLLDVLDQKQVPSRMEQVTDRRRVDALGNIMSIMERDSEIEAETLESDL